VNRSLFLYSLKSGRTGIVVWSAFFFAYALLMMYLLQSMQDIADLLAEYVDKMGPMVKAFAGDVGSIINPDGTLSPGKWLSLEFLALWPLIMSIYAVLHAGGIAAREVERGTMDILLSQPVTRYSVIVSKFLVFPLTLVITAAASILGVLGGMAIIGNYGDLGGICLVFLPAVLLPLAVASYSLLCSVIFLDPRKVLIVAGSLTGLFYILNILARTVESVGWMGRLSIFHYYEPAETASQLSLNWAGIGVYLGIIVVCIAASIYVFQRRDIAL
jgi:ABC-2 type transport system permease protein